MRERFSETDLTSNDTVGMFQLMQLVIRAAGQLIGLILILCGAYYALSILLVGVSFIRNPAELETTLISMAKALNIQEVEIAAGDGKVSLGRTTAALVLFLWFAACAWIASLIISAGGKLVMGIVAERQEFLAAMKEFLITVRREGIASQPRQNDPPA